MKIRILPLIRKEIPTDEEGNRILLPPFSVTGIDKFNLPENIKKIEYRHVQIPVYNEEGEQTGTEDGELDYHVDLYIPYSSRSEWPADRAEYKDRPELFDDSLEAIEITGMNQTELDNFNAAAEQEKINAEARAYLAETDWYIARRAETGKEIPEEILIKRAEAREAIIDQIQ